MSDLARFDGLQAHLLVKNISETTQFYFESLGFYILGKGYNGDREQSCILQRKHATIYCEQADCADDVRPNRHAVKPYTTNGITPKICDVTVELTNLRNYWDEIKENRLKVIASSLESVDVYDQAMPEFIIEDCNGYWICFFEYIPGAIPKE